jgi:hypothetical protein
MCVRMRSMGAASVMNAMMRMSAPQLGQTSGSGRANATRLLRPFSSRLRSLAESNCARGLPARYSPSAHRLR